MGTLGEFAREIVGRMSGAMPATEEQWAAHDAEIVGRRAVAAAETERQRQEDLRRELVELGCPAKDLEIALADDLRPTKALAAARRALESLAGERPTLLLVIAGRPGTGKTTAAAWWLMQRRPRSRFVRTRSPRFLDAARLARWPRYDEERMTEIERAEALVVDDLGVEFDDVKGAFRSLLDELVNSRYAAQLPTLLTTNLSAEQFKARYGERIADRIRECGAFVGDAGPSLRSRRVES